MTTSPSVNIRACGHELDPSPQCLGTLRDCTSIADNPETLHHHMWEHGYVFLRGVLDRNEVLATRLAIVEKLVDVGAVDPAYPRMDAVAHTDYNNTAQHDLAPKIPQLHRLLYNGQMMQFMTRFLGEPVRHYDYTWLRVLAPGKSTPPHCDVVYMGRGTTQRLYTAWTPLGDIDHAMGGLAILENSHQHQGLQQTYCQVDVDKYCMNRSSGEQVKAMFGENGALSRNPRQLRHGLGGRWLVGEYRAGDLLVFNVFMVHCGLDNQTDRVRLSSDSRYQPQSEPIDERWNGSNPTTHGPGAKRGRIC